MKKWLFVVLFLTSSLAFAVEPTEPTKPSACEPLLNPTYLQKKLNEIEVAGASNVIDYRTLSFLGHNLDGQVMLFKNDGLSWASRHTHKDYDTSPQGDPRWFFYFAGTELAMNFRFDIRQGNEGSVFLAPNADTLKRIVEKLNPILIKNGHDPIVFLPIKSGYLTSFQMMEALLSAQKPLLTHFPYDDNNPNLTAHEVAFHLIAMIFPTKFHKKAHEIDLETEKVATEILNLKSDHSKRIAHALREARTLDVDAGNGNLAANFALLRAIFQMKAYRDIVAPPAFTQGAISIIDRLANPFYSAQRTVTDALEKQLKENFIGKPPKEFMHYLNERKKLLEDPVIVFPRTAREDAAQWLTDFFETMDDRIDQLNQAFKEIKP